MSNHEKILQRPHELTEKKVVLKGNGWGDWEIHKYLNTDKNDKFPKSDI